MRVDNPIEWLDDKALRDAIAHKDSFAAIKHYLSTAYANGYNDAIHSMEVKIPRKIEPSPIKLNSH